MLQLSKKIGFSLIVLGLLVVISYYFLLNAQTVPKNTDHDQELVAGSATVYVSGKNAFSLPLANTSNEERTRFAVGNSFFKHAWVAAPSSTTARDGLGPHYLARSCGACHSLDGRGQPPDYLSHLSDEHQKKSLGLLLRLSVPGQIEPSLGLKPHPKYGDQFNTFAVKGVMPEGTVKILYETIQNQYADGTSYTLQKPIYHAIPANGEALEKETRISPRIAPQLAGIGLLEAISSEDILHNQSLQAARTDGIRGMVNKVWDESLKQWTIGRFGWKANTATILHQSAGAFVGDMGITSSLFPNETCTNNQQDCLAAPSGGSPEISDERLQDVVFYQAALAPVARRKISDPLVQQGRSLFYQAQCAVCHRPNYTTSIPPHPSLSPKNIQGLSIWPYTDLLLHDMGEGLADNRPEFSANGRQWKTPALWGIGLIQEVNGHQRLLHDGRANGVAEAILWHGGEADTAKQFFIRLSEQERNALIHFVESL